MTAYYGHLPDVCSWAYARAYAASLADRIRSERDKGLGFGRADVVGGMGDAGRCGDAAVENVIRTVAVPWGEPIPASVPIDAVVKACAERGYACHYDFLGRKGDGVKFIVSRWLVSRLLCLPIVAGPPRRICGHWRIRKCFRECPRRCDENVALWNNPLCEGRRISWRANREMFVALVRYHLFCRKESDRGN